MDDSPDLIEQCYAEGWTDGLPVVPPTEARVAAMIAAAGRGANEVVARIGPAGVGATVEKIAANAVMAGCLPEYMPVVLACMRAAGNPQFGGVGITIHSVSQMVLVNGPVRDQLRFNYQANTLGSGHRANATVGRALRLVLQNVAGMHSGGMDASTLGHPGKYTYCFAENEAASPWEPLHVERGLDEDDSAVTLYLADAPLCLAHQAHDDGAAVLDTIADAMPIAGTYNMFFQQELFVVLSPEHAQLVASSGFETKSRVREYLYERGRKRAGDVLGKGMFGFQTEGMGAGWLRETPSPDTLVSPVPSPDAITLVVSGREVGGYTALIFGAGNSVTERIATS